MSFTQDGRAVGGNLAVENTVKASRVVTVPRTMRSYCLAVTTGTMAAALGAGGAFFAMRLDPGAGSILAYIKRIRIQWTTIAAFTTPITAGRRIGVYRGSGAAASGGTSVPDFLQKDSARPASQCALAEGGDVRVATTAALTVTSIVYETVAAREMSLVHLGAAGAFAEFVVDFMATGDSALVLQPGQLLALRGVPAMDAGGTWTATIIVDWEEALALDSSVVDS